MAKILFSATAGLYIQFLNFIKENEINLYHIKLSPLGFTAICDADDYFFIAKSSRKFQTKVRIEKKKGLYFRIRKLLTRKGIFTAVILFFVMNIVYSNLIWDIDIHTDDATIKNEIVCQLYKQGIYPGKPSKRIIFQTLDRIIFMLPSPV